MKFLAYLGILAFIVVAWFLLMAGFTDENMSNWKAIVLIGCVFIVVWFLGNMVTCANSL